ncbi:tudor domain-containing protein 15 [Salminus brasiliensis]|uniref:tudor domain-containing protein 15 n=1 Tax=Salminus brasiliensis TaxID=930266 RepID=UPI003B83487A
MDWNQVDRSNKSSQLPAPFALWPVDLKLTHVDCNPGDALVHFQGQYLTICELDYNILQVEIQNAQKTQTSMTVGDFCLVEDVLSSRWYRGRVQNKQKDLCDVFLLDYGNVLTVTPNHLAVMSDALLVLPPKIVCGFFANVLPVQECWDSMSEKYFSSLIGTHIKGFIHALLPYKVFILEAPDITKELLRLHLGRLVDTDSFLLLVEMLLEVPVQQSCQSVPDLLIEKRSAQEFSFKCSSLRGFENILSLSGPKLAAGQKERARITAAVNPELFYCQLSSMAKDLEEMSEKLATACTLRTSDRRDAENLGLLCAVKGKDEKWHRGFVQCLPVNSQVRVVFVDYGYCEFVKVENVFQLPSRFLLTPTMAYPCSLTCLSDRDDNNKSQQLVILRSALLGKEVEFTVDGFSKEENVFSVTLSSIDEFAHLSHFDEPINSDVIKHKHGLNCYPEWCRNETKEVKASEDVFLFEEIQDGSVFEAYVEHVQNPNEFWIRTARRNHSFEDMMNKLTDYFSGLQLNEEILDDPLPGVLCCAMYEQDLHYYRAIVLDILEHGAEVFFIDFGNTEKVPSMLIKKMPSEFAVEPPFVLGCSLAHVTPMDDCWTVAATNYFRKATSNKALMVHVVHKRSDTLAVELCERGREKSESISALMTRENMAGYWKYNLTTTPVEFGKAKNKTGKKDLRMFSKSVSQKPDVKGLQQKNVSAHKAVVKKQVHTHTQESKTNAVDIFRHNKIQPGSEISVFCTHVTSPSDFWCQNKKQKVDLDRLMDKLQNVYHAHIPVFLKNSVCCVVKFHQDNRWYRGLVLDVRKEEVEVILIDYGMVVKERLQDIRALLPEFLELEGQAFRCSLHNLIEPAGENTWSKEACNLLKDFVSGGSSNLTCKTYSQLFVVNKGICNVVDLHTPLQQASAYLVEKGVAVESSCPKQLAPYAYPCSFVYSSFHISIGSEELVYPTHVDGPWKIYLQLDRNSAIIDELMERTNKESEELLRQTHGANWDTVCLAKYYGDNKWYRSVSWPAQSSQHLNVFFVDYGNKQVAEKRSVLPIPRKALDLLLIPMQAIRCSLLDIPEREHLPEVNAWLKKTIINRTLQAKFVAKDDSGHFICDLFDGNMHINEKVRELFAIQGQKDSYSSRKSRSDCCKEGMNVSLKGNKFKTKERCHVGTVAKLQRTSDRGQVTQGSRQPCNKRASKFNLECKEQIRGIVQREKGLTKCTYNVQTSKVLPKMSDLPVVKIKPGFRGVGFISHCNSADRFFIQMEKDEQTILKIGEDLNSSLFTENMQYMSEVNVGHLVAAKYEEDLAFYRAVVTSVESSSVLTVEFVDYGNTTTVDRKNIQALTSQFMSHARLSTACTLSKPQVFEDPEYFMKEAHGKPLMVEFVRNLGCAWEVSIKISDPLQESRKHCPEDRKDEQVPSLPQCKSKQELNVTEVVTKDEERSHTLLSCVYEIAHTAKSMKEETKKSTQKSTNYFGTKTKKVGQQNSLRNNQGTSAADCTQKLKTKMSRKYTNRGQDDKQQNESNCGPQVKHDTPVHVCDLEEKTVLHCDSSILDTSLKQPEQNGTGGQDVGERQQSVLGDPHPEDLMDQEDQVQHLFFAPVEMDVEYAGFAAAVTTPSEFYIVLEDLLLVMNAVSNILEGLPEVLSPLPETHLICGTGCLVRSGEKNKWCRAELVQCDDVSLIIHLVDYGHYAHFPRQDVDKLKKLPLELARLPKITYPCLLRGVKSVEEIQWSDKAVVFFQECMSQKNLQICFRQYVSEAQWEIDVVTEGRNIAQDLVDAGHACYIDRVLGIRFQQRQGHKREPRRINIMASVLEVVPSNCEQTQLKKDELPQGSLEEGWSVSNAAKSNEEMSQGCDREGKTELLFSTSCDSPGSGQITYHDPSSGSSQCLLM